MYRRLANCIWVRWSSVGDIVVRWTVVRWNWPTTRWRRRGTERTTTPTKRVVDVTRRTLIWRQERTIQITFRCRGSRRWWLWRLLEIAWRRKASTGLRRQFTTIGWYQGLLTAISRTAYGDTKDCLRRYRGLLTAISRTAYGEISTNPFDDTLTTGDVLETMTMTDSQ